jgi:hypothetical protein
MPGLPETPEAYTPIPLNITKPAEGDLAITPTEKNEMDEAQFARDCNVEIAEIEIHNLMMESLQSVSAFSSGASECVETKTIPSHLRCI